MTQDADDVQRKSTDGINGGHYHKDDFGIFPDYGDKQAQEDDGQGWLASRPRDIFEAVVADCAGHQRAEYGGEKKTGPGPGFVLKGGVLSGFKSREEARRGGGGGGHQ